MTDTKANILLLDDDKFLLDMYAMKFAKEGYEVQACLSADDALECLTHGFKPQAIVFDITMPGKDGFIFLQELRDKKLGEGAQKIALTNQGTDDEKAKAKELGATDYLVKATMIPSEVVNTVAAAISGARTA